MNRKQTCKRLMYKNRHTMTSRSDAGGYCRVMRCRCTFHRSAYLARVVHNRSPSLNNNRVIQVQYYCCPAHQEPLVETPADHILEWNAPSMVDRTEPCSLMSCSCTQTDGSDINCDATPAVPGIKAVHPPSLWLVRH